MNMISISVESQNSKPNQNSNFMDDEDQISHLDLKSTSFNFSTLQRRNDQPKRSKKDTFRENLNLLEEGVDLLMGLENIDIDMEGDMIGEIDRGIDIKGNLGTSNGSENEGSVSSTYMNMQKILTFKGSRRGSPKEAKNLTFGKVIMESNLTGREPRDSGFGKGKRPQILKIRSEHVTETSLENEKFKVLEQKSNKQISEEIIDACNLISINNIEDALKFQSTPANESRNRKKAELIYSKVESEKEFESQAEAFEKIELKSLSRKSDEHDKVVIFGKEQASEKITFSKQNFNSPNYRFKESELSFQNNETSIVKRLRSLSIRSNRFSSSARRKPQFRARSRSEIKWREVVKSPWPGGGNSKHSSLSKTTLSQNDRKFMNQWISNSERSSVSRVIFSGMPKRGSLGALKSRKWMAKAGRQQTEEYGFNPHFNRAEESFQSERHIKRNKKIKIKRMSLYSKDRSKGGNFAALIGLKGFSRSLEPKYTSNAFKKQFDRNLKKEKHNRDKRRNNDYDMGDLSGSGESLVIDQSQIRKLKSHQFQTIKKTSRVKDQNLDPVKARIPLFCQLHKKSIQEVCLECSDFQKMKCSKCLCRIHNSSYPIEIFLEKDSFGKSVLRIWKIIGLENDRCL